MLLSMYDNTCVLYIKKSSGVVKKRMTFSKAWSLHPASVATSHAAACMSSAGSKSTPKILKLSPSQNLRCSRWNDSLKSIEHNPSRVAPNMQLVLCLVQLHHGGRLRNFNLIPCDSKRAPAVEIIGTDRFDKPFGVDRCSRICIIQIPKWRSKYRALKHAGCQGFVGRMRAAEYNSAYPAFCPTAKKCNNLWM